MELQQVPREAKAPVSGLYELLTVPGSRTGVTVRLTRGMPFPKAPRGQEWRLVADAPPA